MYHGYTTQYLDGWSLRNNMYYKPYVVRVPDKENYNMEYRSVLRPDLSRVADRKLSRKKMHNNTKANQKKKPKKNNKNNNNTIKKKKEKKKENE